MTAGVLVAGIGNIFLGDDGFGPEVVRRLGASGEPALPPDARLVDYGIRGMHLLYDLLDDYEALVLIDALPGRGEPGETVVLEVDTGRSGQAGRQLRPARDEPGRGPGRAAGARWPAAADVCGRCRIRSNSTTASVSAPR